MEPGMKSRSQMPDTDTAPTLAINHDLTYKKLREHKHLARVPIMLTFAHHE
jgi:hypothetical protein